MIAGVDINEAIKAVGHAKATKTKELVSGIRKLGFDCQDRLKIISGGAIPDRSIVKIALPNTSNWHWVVKNNDKIYDPAETIIPEKLFLSKFKATSFLKPKEGGI